MKTPKNPGLGARSGSIEAALAVNAGTATTQAPEDKPEEKPVAISIRFPKAIHEELRRIAYERRVSIHSLILAGVKSIISHHQ